MDLLRVDVVTIYDLRFDHVGRIPWPLLGEGENRTPIASRLEESSSWVFYADHLKGFDSYDLSAVIPDSAGAALRINRQSGVGSFLVWRKREGHGDPLDCKQTLSAQVDQDFLSIEPLFRQLRGDRVYPFVSIQADEDVEGLDDFATSNALELGRLLTSDMEGERPFILERYIENDLSLRAYEKLFLRWTDALAVYARPDSDEFYENCMFRAVQIFEHCVLGQVSFISALERMDRFSQRLALVTPRKWLRARELFISLADAEFVFVVYPRTSSAEANRLLAAAHDQFGLGTFLASAKAKGAELRDQFEWAKAQTLGLIVLATYLLDKIVGWDNMRCWLWTILRHR